MTSPQELFELEEEDAKEQKIEGDILVDALLRSCLSMRGHLNTALVLVRDVADAIKRKDMKTLAVLAIDAEGLIAENQLLGMDVTKSPTYPADGMFTMDVLEGVVGTQRARLSAARARTGRG